jgi:hypothetical protein
MQSSFNSIFKVIIGQWNQNFLLLLIKKSLANEKRKMLFNFSNDR